MARSGSRGVVAGVIGHAVALGLVMLACVAPALAQAPRTEAGRAEARIERNHARIVFTFGERPRHQVTVNPGVLVIRFDRPVDVGVEAIAGALRGFVSNVRRDPDGLAVRFALQRRVRVNTTEAAEQLYVDLLAEPWSGPVPPLPPEVVAELARRAEEEERQRQEEIARRRRMADAGPVQVVTIETPTFSRMEFRWREPVQGRMEREGPRARIIFEKLGTIEAGPVRARLPRLVESFELDEQDFRTIVTMDVPSDRDVRTFHEGSSFIFDVTVPNGARPGEVRSDELQARAPAEAPARQLQRPARQRQTGQRPPTATDSPAPAQAASTPTAPLVPEASYAAGTARIVFPFQAPTSAAVFVRDTTLWMVFETRRAVDPKELGQALPSLVRGVQRVRFDPVEVIRVELAEPLLVATVANGSAWEVHIGANIPREWRAISLSSRTSADGRAIVHADLPKASWVHKLVDPVVGDTLTVVTAMEPAAALVRAQRYVDFDVLRSAHGLVVRDAVDDLEFQLTSDGVRIERNRGLSVSVAGQTRTRAAASPLTQDARLGFVDAEGWRLGAREAYHAIRATLVARAANSTDDTERTQLRFDLARFHVAHGQPTDALGVLALILRDMPAVERDASYRALRGIAAAMAERNDIVDRDLNDPAFEDNADIALWRGLSQVARGDFAAGARSLTAARSVLPGYERPLQARALLALARAQIETRDIGGTNLVLEEAQGLDPSPEGRARLDLLRGRYREASGNLPQALEIYERVRATELRGFSEEANLRRVALATRMQQMAPLDAIAALEGTALSWRGDHIERDIHALIARQAARLGDYRRAFAAMNSVVQSGPDSDAARALQDDMREAFAALFLEGGADDRPPLEVLALFYDYREMVPPGRRGDEMIRNLAGRLVDLDLLDQAIELLNHQVENRLQAAARADVAAQLAFVHLMNREPEKALTVLRRTRMVSLPQELERRRLVLEARALGGIGRADLAVELLGEQTGTEVAQLRADLLWEGRHWAQAGAAIEAVHGDAWRRRDALGEIARRDILRAGVAFALAGDSAALERLRTRWTPLFEGTPQAALFATVTGRIEAQGTEFRAVVRDVAGYDAMQRFVREYRESFRPGSVGAPPRPAGPPQAEATTPERRG